MRVEEDTEYGTLVVLSRRNLLTLLAKLDGNPPDSACTIGAPAMYGHLHVRAEEDDVHYGHPDRKGDPTPGPMHPDTESVVADPLVAHGYRRVPSTGGGAKYYEKETT